MDVDKCFCGIVPLILGIKLAHSLYLFQHLSEVCIYLDLIENIVLQDIEVIL